MNFCYFQNCHEATEGLNAYAQTLFEVSHALGLHKYAFLEPFVINSLTGSDLQRRRTREAKRPFFASSSHSRGTLFASVVNRLAISVNASKMRKALYLHPPPRLNLFFARLHIPAVSSVSASPTFRSGLFLFFFLPSCPPGCLF